MKARAAGLFVGGKSARMGGEPKGLLVGPHGAPLAKHLAELAREACGELALVGRAQAYRALLPDVPALDDAPELEGPLAGLLALLRWAGERPVIALACDLPYLEQPLLARLADAPLEGHVLAPRPDALWQPFFAKYAPSALPALERAVAGGARSFQRAFDALDVRELSLSDVERAQLRDWDTPDDVR